MRRLRSAVHVCVLIIVAGTVAMSLAAGSAASQETLINPNQRRSDDQSCRNGARDDWCNKCTSRRSGPSAAPNISLAQAVPIKPQSPVACSLPPTGTRLPAREVAELKNYVSKAIMNQCLDATRLLLPMRDAALTRNSQEARNAADIYVERCLNEQLLIDLVRYHSGRDG